ncbi:MULTISPECIES: RapZ C-terminal domain-containing protein [Streptomyces]|uniref:RapZ C-terminal domain-containing protein n=1 Tax=Streptomyces TaxID=1883 RepID=UPI0033E75087
MTDDKTPLVRVISFGYGHTGALGEDGRVLEPPTADITLDLRRVLHNPHHDPAMRELTGLDKAVYDHVRATPGAELPAQNTALTAHWLMDQARPTLLTVAVGCTGGRHRAVATARLIHALLTDLSKAGGYDVELSHRDVHRAVLPSTSHRP